MRGAATTPARRATVDDVRTPIDWTDAASLRAELALIDARRATIVAALARLDETTEALVIDSESSDGSLCDLTQPDAGDDAASDASDDGSAFDLTQATVDDDDAPPSPRADAALNSPRAEDALPSPRADAALTVDADESSDGGTVDLTEATPAPTRRRARIEARTPPRERSARELTAGMVSRGDPSADGVAASPRTSRG